MGGEEAGAADRSPVGQRQADRIDLERAGALEVTGAIGKCRSLDFPVRFSQLHATSRDERIDHVCEDHEVALRHAQKSSFFSSATDIRRTRRVASRCSRAASAGSLAWSSVRSEVPGAIASR